MKRRWGSGAICVALLVFEAGIDRPTAVEPPGMVEQFAVFRQTRADGAYLDWFDGHAGILGRATKFQDLKLKPYFLEAEQMAATEGRSKLMDYLRTLPIDGTRRLGDDAILFGKVRALLDRTPPEKSEAILPYGMKVMVRLPLFGARGIMGVVLGEAGGGPAAEPAAQTAAEPAVADDGTTGLVIDATAVAELSPALLPKIVDQAGRVVHGLETADLKQALLRGVATYAIRAEVQKTHAAPPAINTRQGDRPLRVTAIGAAGPGKVWAVVSVADADRILKEAASSPFLKNCSVLILAPPGGLRTAPPLAAPSHRSPSVTSAPRRDP